MSKPTAEEIVQSYAKHLKNMLDHPAQSPEERLERMTTLQEIEDQTCAWRPEDEVKTDKEKEELISELEVCQHYKDIFAKEITHLQGRIYRMKNGNLPRLPVAPESMEKGRLYLLEQRIAATGESGFFVVKTGCDGRYMIEQDGFGNKVTNFRGEEKVALHGPLPKLTTTESI